MKHFIKFAEALCASFIVLGGINIFFPLAIGILDPDFFSELATGAIVFYAIIICMKKKDWLVSKSAIVLTMSLLFGLSTDLHAQEVNYTKQVEAFKQSFAEKNPDPIKPFLSPELAFYSYPTGATSQILSQVVANLPTLNTIEITESKPGEITVQYSFTALGERESKIRFDETGNITKIELIDNLLEEQAKAQAALANQVQEPTPGELGEKYRPKKVVFPSRDGLTITGDLYEIDPAKPIILLCHSGGRNKYEYADIAPKLNAKGFNALAIDQRSGGAFAGHPNETFQEAKSKGLGTAFVDAEQDIEAAIEFLANKYDKKVTLWGSSYSAALSLFIVQKSNHLNGMMLFSPGDYLAGEKGSLKGRLASLDIPFLMTSTRQEAEEITTVLLEGLSMADDQIQHIPSFEGYHGSSALWEGQNGAGEYWKAVDDFLAKLYPDYN